MVRQSQTCLSPQIQLQPHPGVHRRHNSSTPPSQWQRTDLQGVGAGWGAGGEALMHGEQHGSEFLQEIIMEVRITLTWASHAPYQLWRLSTAPCSWRCMPWQPLLPILQHLPGVDVAQQYMCVLCQLKRASVHPPVHGTLYSVRSYSPWPWTVPPGCNLEEGYTAFAAEQYSLKTVTPRGPLDCLLPNSRFRQTHATYGANRWDYLLLTER